MTLIENELNSVVETIIRSVSTASRSDLMPKLVGIQRILGARHFVLLRAVGSGFPHKRKLHVEVESWSSGTEVQGSSILETLSDTLLSHIDVSMLPIVWEDFEGNGIAHQPLSPELITPINIENLPFAGIAFPVRMGTIGNGYALFCGGNLILDNEMLLEQHVKACQLMVELLSMDERRVAPAEALSEREIACLQLASDGRISEEIAVTLGLSVHTVNAYLSSATSKLDSVNRIQAIAKAIRLGYIH